MYLPDNCVCTLDEIEANNGKCGCEALSDSGQSTGSVELLRELIDACSPYLRRKKMTPRHECNALNYVWAKCAEHLEKQNENNEGRIAPKETTDD